MLTRIIDFIRLLLREDRQIPLIVERCCQYIADNGLRFFMLEHCPYSRNFSKFSSYTGLEKEGIFRRSANFSTLNEVINNLNDGIIFTFR